MREPDEIYIEGALIVLDGSLRDETIGGRRIFYREGFWCVKNEEGKYEPDWSLTCFFDDPAHPERFIYFEQDPPEIAIRNLKTIIKLTGGTIEHSFPRAQFDR